MELLEVTPKTASDLECPHGVQFYDVVEGDKRRRSQYGVVLVNPPKHASVKKDLGQQFINWLISADGQNAIADYKINGEQLFYPDANDPNA